MHPRRRSQQRGELGETLVEVLVAISILGIAAVAILAGLQLTIRVSTIQRNEATGGALVRSVGETIQNWVAAGNYKACAGSGYYTSNAGLSLPAGYTATQTAAQSWNGTTWVGCSTDNGVQQVVLTVTTPGDATHQANETLTIVLRKPCTTASSC